MQASISPCRQHIFDFFSFRQTLDRHPFGRLPAGNLLLLVGANLERARRHAVLVLQHAAHPERHRIEVGAHADRFSGEVFGSLNTACGVDQQIAVAELAVGKNRDRAERRAARHPAEKHAHLKFAHVEFQVAGKSPVALF